MKTIKSFLILLIILFPLTIFSQGYLGKSSISVYGTAKAILGLYNPDGSFTGEVRSQILEELAKLYSTDDNPVDTEQVKKIIEIDNLPICNILYKQRFNDYADKYNYNKKRGGLSPNCFFITITDILEGKIMSAAKSTLFTLLLNNLFAEEEMRILFTNTSGFFNTFTNYHLKASPRMFSETFKSDLKEIPFNIPKIFTQVKKYRDTLDRYPHLKLFLEANRYYRELNALKPFNEFNNKTLNNLKDTNIIHSELYNSLKLMQFVYFQFRKESSYENYGMPEKLYDLNDLADNKVLQDIYLGLMCAQCPPIEFALVKDNKKPESGGQSGETVQVVQMTTILNQLRKTESQNRLINYFHRFTEKYNELIEINKTIQNIQSIDTSYYYYSGPNPEELKNEFFDKSIEFLQYAMDPTNIFPEGKFDKSEINLFIDIIKKNKALQQNIDKEQNLAAVMNTFYIYGDLCKTHSAFGIIFNGFSGDFLKGMSVVADLLSAKNEEDFARIANDYVFSNTDANAKKESNFSLLLNSYGGIYYGKQFDDVRNNWTRNKGIMVPIGFEISKGFKDFGNLSLFVPLLDVGAIMDFKLSSDSAEIETKLELDNIISPGLYLTYGFPKIPVSIGGGFQFSPHLSKINLNGKIIEPRKLRWNVFLAFDLPLLRIF